MFLLVKGLLWESIRDASWVGFGPVYGSTIWCALWGPLRRPWGPLREHGMDILWVFFE